jgi:DNA polymerase-4
LKRVPLERPLRLIGVRVGALVRADSAEAAAPATSASRARTPPDAAAQTASLF